MVYVTFLIRVTSQCLNGHLTTTSTRRLHWGRGLDALYSMGILENSKYNVANNSSIHCLSHVILYYVQYIMSNNVYAPRTSLNSVWQWRIQGWGWGLDPLVWTINAFEWERIVGTPIYSGWEPPFKMAGSAPVWSPTVYWILM